jgi:hypothetical protein
LGPWGLPGTFSKIADHPADRGTDAGSSRARRAGPESVVSPEEQVAAHVRYRETVEVRYRETWAEAVPRLRAAWQEHKEGYPERTRASSRTEADGTWVGGEHRRLNPEQNAEASKAHADLADEADRHFLTWESSPLLHAAEHGDTMLDFVPITEGEAAEIVDRIRAESGQGGFS